MKLFVLVTIAALGFSSAFSQNAGPINVPDFADAKAKKFYTTYANHLLLCVDAIRQKDETKALALFKDPGEKLVKEERVVSAEVVKNPTEKKKYIEFANEVYPYLKEVQNSAYYKKISGNK